MEKAEGNRTSRTDGEELITYYWDHRNRLTEIRYGSDPENPDNRIVYTYDANNRMSRYYDGEASIENFVYDGDRMVTRYGDYNAGIYASRYLWGPAIDQLLAEENRNGGATDTRWSLNDHQQTVRDMLTYNTSSNVTSVQGHQAYNAYGGIEGTPQDDWLFAFTGRYRDPASGLQWNQNRWYDPNTGEWMSEDPIGFAGGVNLGQYVGNNPVNWIDPAGLAETYYDHDKHPGQDFAKNRAAVKAKIMAHSSLHHNYLYEKSSGIQTLYSNVIDSLDNYVSNVVENSFQVGGDALATWGYISGNLHLAWTVSSADTSTLIHELVHATDQRYGWNISAFPYATDLRSAEALAYGVESLLGSTKTIRKFEDGIRNRTLPQDRVQSQWEVVWTDIIGVLHQPVFVGSAIHGNVTAADVKAIKSNLGFGFSHIRLAVLYEDLLWQEGYRDECGERILLKERENLPLVFK